MRHEFSKSVKRDALKRSNMLCEAVGEVYGLLPGQRCNAPLSHGVEFDHYPIAATERDSDGLDNCVACCKTCHGHKTRTFDIPAQAKSKRVSDKHLGIRKPSTWATRPLGNGNHQHTATTKPTKRVGQFAEES
jgi:5-methylcytosine-specific restriction protein A